jgi:hypothetical protein
MFYIFKLLLGHCDIQHLGEKKVGGERMRQTPAARSAAKSLINPS